MHRWWAGALVTTAMLASACGSEAHVVRRSASFSMQPVISMKPGACPSPAASDGTVCYQLGPSFLSAADIASAHAENDVDTPDPWIVAVRVKDSSRTKYLTGIHANVNHQVAMVLDGKVVSAPYINPGITGSLFVVSGNFGEAKARHIAAELDPTR